jgi:hypothetical protein
LKQVDRCADQRQALVEEVLAQGKVQQIAFHPSFASDHIQVPFFDHDGSKVRAHHRVQLPALHELPEPSLSVWRDVSVAVEPDIECVLGSMRDHTSKQKILITIEPVADLLIRRETELRDRDNNRGLNRVVSANNIVGDALLSCRRRGTIS